MRWRLLIVLALLGAVAGQVVLRDDFASRLSSGEMAPTQLIVDGVDSNSARSVVGYVRAVWNDWLIHWARGPGSDLEPPIALVVLVVATWLFPRRLY
ncbi:MAG: hypothetical protein FJX56_03085 [Alphaproteobacteria bacterium]|nr:hypothetical protein [Alphaproteobacteria bacterium]